MAHLSLLVLQGLMQKTSCGLDADSLKWAQEVNKVSHIFMSHQDREELVRHGVRLHINDGGTKVTQRCPVQFGKTLM